ncbi:MAG: phytanoyl-CoA dioxygenase family protein [Acidimicrobiia bacterium]
MSVDLRTRIDGPTAALDTAEFFGHDLLRALADQADDIEPGTRLLDPRALAIEVVEPGRAGGDAWTLTWTGDGFTIGSGIEPDAAHVRLSTAQLDDLVADRSTFMAWISSGQLDQPAGRLSDLLDWWVILRAAIDARPVHTPGVVSFPGRDSETLDLNQSFTLVDDPAEMRHFLETAGFLHLTGVFSEAEMAEVSADMDRAAPSYADGDGRSWWARTADGTRQVVRMQAFDGHSPLTAALLDDDRFLSLREIPGVGHEFGARRSDNRIEALFKPIGVVEGISDVPWHKDCSLGRHSYECCSMTVGISVTGADAVSGQLRVVAGSHRALVWPAFVRPGNDLPQIDLATATGDVTVHLSCTMHMAQPPIERERRVMYTGFGLPAPDPVAAAAGRAQLRAVREAAPVTVSQKSTR